jgi:hypothetical protein
VEKVDARTIQGKMKESLRSRLPVSSLQIFDSGWVLSPSLELPVGQMRKLRSGHESDVPSKVQMMVSVAEENLKLCFIQLTVRRKIVEPVKLFRCLG